MDRNSLSKLTLWRHYPWMLGLGLSPILLGSVNPEGQAAAALLFAVSLFLLAPCLAGSDARQPACKPFWCWLALLCLALPLIPLPMAWVEALSPNRAALARQFPIEPGVVPTWLSLTISPASTVQRLCELALIVTAFWLARHAAIRPGFPRQFALLMGMTLLVLAASDVWFRLDGQRRLLGLWPNSAGHAAGTFANRNHFADWIYVAALFTSGWILRNRWPLLSARPGHFCPADRSSLSALFLGGAIAFALAMAVISGSRGGFLALLAGVAVWVTLLAKRSRSQGRWLALGATGAIVLVAGVLAGEYLLGRLAEARVDSSFKISIWRDSLRICAGFPFFGSGPGTFERAFNHFKTFGGQQSFLHAENDWLQMFVESGLIGALILGVLGYRLIGGAFRFAWSESAAEPELVFGALAGLTAFGVHALVEFVFQITANALLAASLLGFVLGSRDRATQHVVVPPPTTTRLAFHVGWAFALLVLSTLQIGAFVLWQQARAPQLASGTVDKIKASLRFWPWDASRSIALARAQVRLLELGRDGRAREDPAPAREIRQQLNDALCRDPLNWELRLERTWIDFAFGTNADRALQEAWEVVRLNPLQPQVPLRFARHLGQRDPDSAMAFVRAAPRATDPDLKDGLALAWSIEQEPAALWSLTPARVSGLLVLGDFAIEQRLFPLAAQAFQRLTNRVAPLVLAEKFLRAQRPDLALSVIRKAPATPAARLLLGQACWASGQYPEAIQHAESLWLESGARRQILSSMVARENSRREEGGQEKLSEAALACRQAEEICARPAREGDLPVLRALVRRFPDDLRITWLLFQTERELNRFREAADTALHLASRAAAPGASPGRD